MEAPLQPTAFTILGSLRHRTSSLDHLFDHDSLAQTNFCCDFWNSFLRLFYFAQSTLLDAETSPGTARLVVASRFLLSIGSTTPTLVAPICFE
mmetsp:Transcript_457/g.777  ORF Transcript_457/g.777 Transcript_457/m.777 type:complete len:93 (+) Transcript_457:1202-1480(+)